MQKEIINDGLSYKEKLECIAKRFGMTQEQALKEIIHEIYTSSVTFTGLQTAMILIGYYEEKSSFVEYDSVGNVIVDDNCNCLLYTSPSPRDPKTSRMPSSA